MPEVRYWAPGPGFTVAIAGHSWWKADGERAVIAVALCPPRSRPAWDGSEWTEPEIWTVRFQLDDDETIKPAPGDDYGNGVAWFLCDKPWRISWWHETADSPGREVLSRVPAGRLDGARLTGRFGLIWYATGRDRRAYRLWTVRAASNRGNGRQWRRNDVRRYRHWQRKWARNG